MNKSDLAAALAAKTGLSKDKALKYTNATLEIIGDTLAEGDALSLPGFGSFSVTERAARDGRNPHTGKPMKIKAKKVVRFKPGKNLKEAVE